MKKLLKLAAVVAGATLASKLIRSKKSEWNGLSETDARAKLDLRIPKEIPGKKRDDVIDKIIDKMMSKGLVTDDEESPDLADTVEHSE